METRNRLIAFEGIDGSGKTTQVNRLNEALIELLHAPTIVKAKYPNQDEALRSFTEEFDITTDSIAFMFAYQALHRMQFEKTMEALQDGLVVISDRWNGSFFVYHSIYGQLSSMPYEVLLVLDELAFGSIEPGITFLLDMPSPIAAKRRINRGETVEEQEIDFYESIAKKYREMAGESNWIVIDATKDEDEIHNIILKIVLNRLSQC